MMVDTSVCDPCHYCLVAGNKLGGGSIVINNAKKKHIECKLPLQRFDVTEILTLHRRKRGHTLMNCSTQNINTSHCHGMLMHSTFKVLVD